MRERGFTLLEVMIALFVAGVVMAGLVPVFTFHVKKNNESEVKTGAIAAAQIKLDEIRQVEETETLPSAGAQENDAIAVNGRSYAVNTTYCGDATYCTTLYNRHIRVEVEYNDKEYFNVETVFTRLK